MTECKRLFVLMRDDKPVGATTKYSKANAWLLAQNEDRACWIAGGVPLAQD